MASKVSRRCVGNNPATVEPGRRRRVREGGGVGWCPTYEWKRKFCVAVWSRRVYETKGWAPLLHSAAKCDRCTRKKKNHVFVFFFFKVGYPCSCVEACAEIIKFYLKTVFYVPRYSTWEVEIVFYVYATLFPFFFNIRILYDDLACVASVQEILVVARSVREGTETNLYIVSRHMATA